MFNLANLMRRCNLAANLGVSLKNPQINALFSLPMSFSSSKCEIENSNTVHYLMNSCGFPPEKAISYSKYTNIKPDKANTVLAFFKNYGFTQSQISILIKRHPRILLSDPEKTFLLKLEFLSSLGLSRTDITSLLTVAPKILESSLENKIIPCYKFFRDLLKSDEKTIRVIKRAPKLLALYIHANVVQNIQCLQELGVPELNMMRFITRHPLEILKPADKFRQIAEEVKKMGFDPLRGNFVWAVLALGSMSKSTWEKKVEIYKKWGLSEKEIFVAFGKTTWFMLVSEEKIERVMDFLINKMGMKSSVFVQRPALISYSLDKRMVPRLLFHKILLDRGLMKKEKDFSVTSWLMTSEKDFINRIMKDYKEEAPELLKLYQSKMDSAK